ncbi:MAG: hypothetical protein JO166_06540 [Deltaproteobacteria bacterium]|nr:hypothetical protein [Deltaproteobacteria bacterium]
MEDKLNEKDNVERKRRDDALDKTIADSFPTSDPPSTIPDPLPESPGSTIDKD